MAQLLNIAPVPQADKCRCAARHGLGWRTKAVVSATESAPAHKLMRATRGSGFGDIATAPLGTMQPRRLRVSTDRGVDELADVSLRRLRGDVKA